MRELEIVVADDDVALLRLLEKQVGKAGYPVHPCTNGDDAFELVANKEPVILLADWKMPGMTGIELCRKIRETRPDGAVYIILLTGNDRRDQIVEGFQAGADDYLTKPAHPEVLLARIRAGARILRLLEEGKDRARILTHRAMEAKLLHSVTAMAAEIDSRDEALQKTLDMVCEAIGWPIGHVYVPANDDSGELKPTGIWHLEAPVPEFVAVTETTRFAPGVGLPGCVLSTGKPAWITNVQEDSDFKRVRLFNDIGIKGAFAFPVMIAGEVVAILEFFFRKKMTPDKTLLAVMQSIGEQIGRVFERRRDEKQLRLQGAALDAAANAIVITDTQGNICWTNQAFESLTGYGRDEVIGLSTAMLKSGEQDEAFYEDLWKVISSGHVWQGEMVNRKKDGTLYPEEMTITPVRDDRGRVTHFIAIKQDISIRKQAEAEITKRFEIEGERNHLRDAVKAQERLLGVVGHELRTPLAGIRAISELLIDEGSRDLEEFDVFLRNIHDEVVRMSGMVNDLLEVARMHSGAAQWNWSEVSLQEACEAAMSTVRPLIDQDKVELLLEVHPAGLVMRGDTDGIRRLVLNLLNNACKNTPEGSIYVLATGSQRDGHAFVNLTVGDTGTGMTPEVAQRLGQAFALNSGVVGDSHVRGSGLGLAICRGIATAHGGTISVKSAQGKGSTFTALLRADLEEPMSTDKETQITCEVA